ncbi:prepilin peptidase [uncultured Anaerotruncus sp.]|uniref:prepilin peptidase n=1 Tax=uncultured Anaerotruncus sp. TaxID=905011 RepID=UPI00280A7FBE|nr:prepilin peptidase [uncultured Anaerotruncus sp.]
MLWLFERLPAALALLFGLVVGSFLNVCIYRIPLGISVAKGRSFCPSCGEKIAWYDNVPLLSFLVLRGRCRRCGARISPRYPAVETANALLWLLCCLSHGYSAGTLLLCLALSALLTAAMIDRDTGIIPDRISVFLAALACCSLFTPGFPSPLARLGGALCVSVPMLLAALLWDGFGGGDIKLCAAFGLLAGWRLSLLAILFASVSGAAWAVFLLLRRGAGRKTAFPFGPFLAAGMGLSLLWGEELIGWYLSLFLL